MNVFFSFFKMSSNTDIEVDLTRPTLLGKIYVMRKISDMIIEYHQRLSTVNNPNERQFIEQEIDGLQKLLVKFVNHPLPAE